MSPLSVKEARQRFGSIIDAAVSGESTTITKRGKPAARVIPIETKRQRLPDLRRFRASLRLTGAPLSASIVAAREAQRF